MTDKRNKSRQILRTATDCLDLTEFIGRLSLSKETSEIPSETKNEVPWYLNSNFHSFIEEMDDKMDVDIIDTKTVTNSSLNLN